MKCKARVRAKIKSGRAVSERCKREARSSEGLCVQHLKQAMRSGKARKRLI